MSRYDKQQVYNRQTLQATHNKMATIYTLICNVLLIHCMQIRKQNLKIGPDLLLSDTYP
jgi:hypothetical protein